MDVLVDIFIQVPHVEIVLPVENEELLVFDHALAELIRVLMSGGCFLPAFREEYGAPFDDFDAVACVVKY